MQSLPSRSQVVFRRCVSRVAKPANNFTKASCCLDSGVGVFGQFCLGARAKSTRNLSLFYLLSFVSFFSFFFFFSSSLVRVSSRLVLMLACRSLQRIRRWPRSGEEDLKIFLSNTSISSEEL